MHSCITGTGHIDKQFVEFDIKRINELDGLEGTRFVDEKVPLRAWGQLGVRVPSGGAYMDHCGAAERTEFSEILRKPCFFVHRRFSTELCGWSTASDVGRMKKCKAP